MFDSLAVAQELTAGGVDRDQAEVIANAMRKVADRSADPAGRARARQRDVPVARPGTRDQRSAAAGSRPPCSRHSTSPLGGGTCRPRAAARAEHHVA